MKTSVINPDDMNWSYIIPNALSLINNMIGQINVRLLEMSGFIKFPDSSINSESTVLEAISSLRII